MADAPKEQSRRNKWSKRAIQLILVAIVAGLVLRYQVNRPKTAHIYYTSDPKETSRYGVKYTCGCDLPTIMQDPQNSNPTDPSNSASEHNRSLTNVCQEKSSTETVNVLMYPNFVESGNPNFTQNGILDGTLETAYGHNFTLAFAYNCSDCTRCSLESVNQIFKDISGDFNSSWGSCAYWWHTDGNQCANGTNWYTAKCVLYPTEALPLSFGIGNFLQALSNLLPGADDDIFTPEDLAAKNGSDGLLLYERSSASFSANVI